MSDAVAEPQAPRRTSNWNIANALTMVRIIAVPFFGWALLTQDGRSAGWRWVALAIFVLAMITDKIDGDLARKHNLITDLGKIADPIADKALTGMAFVGLSLIGELWWWVTALVLLREWGITVMRLVMVRRGVVLPAGQGGKLKTVVQSVALGMFVAPLRLWTGVWNPVGDALWWCAAALMAVAVALTVGTGADYVGKTLAAQRRQRH